MSSEMDSCNCNSEENIFTEEELQKQKRYLEEIAKDIENLIEDAVKTGKVIEEEYIEPEEAFSYDVYDEVMTKYFGNPTFYDYEDVSNEEEIKKSLGDVRALKVIEAYEKTYKNCDVEGNCKEAFARIVSTYLLVDGKYVDDLYFVVSVVPLDFIYR